jgi:protein phosphatase-4 regulatory subunit 3
MNGARRWQGVRDMDADEEAYFNTSDDEEKEGDENAPPAEMKITPVKILNGSPPLRPLVDYADDDDDEPDKSKEAEAQNAPLTPTTPPPAKDKRESDDTDTVVPPPKRRKESDEEDDELGKLSKSKRRSSSSGGSGVVTRKRGFSVLGGSASPGQSPSKKIAISLAPKASSAAGSPPPKSPEQQHSDSQEKIEPEGEKERV